MNENSRHVTISVNGNDDAAVKAFRALIFLRSLISKLEDLKQTLRHLILLLYLVNTFIAFEAFLFICLDRGKGNRSSCFDGVHAGVTIA